MDAYELEGKALVLAGLDQLDPDLLGQWNRVGEYQRTMQAVVLETGGCGHCSRPLEWKNFKGQTVCAHTGQPCHRKALAPVLARWAIINGRKS